MKGYDMRVMALIIPALLFSSPAPSQSVDADAEAKESIVASATAFSAAYMRGDVEAMMDLYTDDAVILPGGMDIIGSRDSIRAYWTPPPGRRTTHHRSMPVQISIVGNTAYDYGYYEGVSVRDGGDPAPFRGKYVIVWVKGIDGTWRMKVDMWNTRARVE